MARWPKGLGDGHWPQVWDLPQKSHHVDDTGSSPVRAEHSQATPRQKVHIGYISYQLRVARWPRGRRRTLATTTDPWVDWAQQPWLAASLGEEQLRFETHECQECWTGLTCDQGSGPVLWTYTGRKTLPPSTGLPVMVEIAGVPYIYFQPTVRNTVYQCY